MPSKSTLPEVYDERLKNIDYRLQKLEKGQDVSNSHLSEIKDGIAKFNFVTVDEFDALAVRVSKLESNQQPLLLFFKIFMGVLATVLGGLGIAFLNFILRGGLSK